MCARNKKSSDAVERMAKIHKAIYSVYLCQGCVRLTLLGSQMDLTYEHPPRKEFVHKSGIYCAELE